MIPYHITTQDEYALSYEASIKDPTKFWNDIAENNFKWYQKWDTINDYNFEQAKFSWFKNAKLNITENCIDRHADKTPNKTAIIFEANDPNESSQHINYSQLKRAVCKMANVLKKQGIQKGDRVILYLPMIPELAYAVLACARIGAVHSVVFAGFSSSALASRINDCEAKLLITADGSFRGNKTLGLKSIVDDALEQCPCVEKVLVAIRTNGSINLKENRDILLAEALKKESEECPAEIMDAEDPLFILYTSGSTGKPKGMMHTTAGYMVYTAYTFKNVFNYKEGDVYWCTADIGWITGHSYIIYGPLCNGATSIMFEGTPSFPDCGCFWRIVEKHKVNQFYTAPTAIRALAKESLDLVNKYDLSSLQVLGTVGEPINEEAWHWYDEHIGKKNCPIVDTWWQTETGGILISPLPNITKTIPTFATKPLPGVQAVLLDKNQQQITAANTEGALCIKYPWPSMARTIWGNHQRYKDTYFSAFENHYFTGDGAKRDENGNYRIIGRMDDVIIVSGHNLGTAPIEDAINEHSNVAESAIVGSPHDIKGNALYGFITLKDASMQNEDLPKEINQLISEHVGPIAKLDKIQFTSGLPKTRSGKIMRRILRKIACNELDQFGDISTLLNPEVVDDIANNRV